MLVPTLVTDCGVLPSMGVAGVRDAVFSCMLYGGGRALTTGNENKSHTPLFIAAQINTFITLSLGVGNYISTNDDACFHPRMTF